MRATRRRPQEAPAVPQPLALTSPDKAQHATRLHLSRGTPKQPAAVLSIKRSATKRQHQRLPSRLGGRDRRCGGRRQPHLAPALAGRSPVLANGFTGVYPGQRTGMEYYLSRGMDINPPCGGPNLSFPAEAGFRKASTYFSNGMDPEYAVMGRVARRRGASEFAGQMP